MAAPDARLDSDNATIIEIKGGSLVSFAPSVPFAVSDDSSDGNKDPDEAETGQRPDGPTGFAKPRPVSGASRVSVPGVPSTTSIIKASSLRHPDAGTALKASKWVAAAAPPASWFKW
ncbi:uncharacterized protein LOC117649589 [Thrips palmi]|uniref:Uncharacterized protein LOC117649589 n=1 Tax=Thrips palmi TaxID=161013 RepID=A0A6P8ZTG2_THRPL|nr:uncharacterized protein LOC117649589 [Thrips palmi]